SFKNSEDTLDRIEIESYIEDEGIEDKVKISEPEEIDFAKDFDPDAYDSFEKRKNRNKSSETKVDFNKMEMVDFLTIEVNYSTNNFLFINRWKRNIVQVVRIAKTICQRKKLRSNLHQAIQHPRQQILFF